MPRNGSGVYSKPPGTTAVPNTTIESAKFNSVVNDLVQDANAPRPVVAGGTGGNSVLTALDNFGLGALGSLGAMSTGTGRVLNVRDNRTTSGSDGNAVFSVTRQDNNNPAVSIGNDGNNAGLIGADNATLRLGKWVTGVFTDALQLFTNGNARFFGDIGGPDNFTIGNTKGEEVAIEETTGRVLIRTGGSTRLLVDAAGSTFGPPIRFDDVVTVGGGVVSGSATNPTINFGSSVGIYRVSNAIRFTYAGSGVLDVVTSGISVTGGATITANAIINGTIDSDGTYSNTTSSASNMVVNSNGFFQRSTSALKYKTAIEEIPEWMIDAFMSMSGVTYKSAIPDDDPDRVHIGMIADYAHDLGLTPLVSYNGEGGVESLQYERCVAILLEVVKDLKTRVVALENPPQEPPAA